MDQERLRLERIRLLSARFYELQGLRVALAGACMVLGVGGYLFAAPEPTDAGAIVAWLVSFAPVIPGMRWLNRYYATTFGRQVWNPSRKPLVFLAVYFVVAWTLNHGIPSIPAGAPTVATVALFSVWVAVRDWPWRPYYLGATAAVAIGFAAGASGAGILAPGMTLGTMFVLLGASLVPIGLLDHLLLVKLMKEARGTGGDEGGESGFSVMKMRSLLFRSLSPDSLAADLRTAVRSLLRARGFATAAVLTFALGVTINVTVFSVVDRLMFRPFPYADSAQLVQLHQSLIPGSGDQPTSSGIMGEVSLAIAQRTKAFTGVAWAEGFPAKTSVAAGQPPLFFSVATSNILDVLGIRTVLGRGFVPDDVASPARSVVLTYEAWQRQFGGSKDVLTARWGTGLDAYQVIGVLPPGFLLPSSRFMEQCDGLFAGAGVWVNAIPGALSVGAVARLRPGVSIDAADAEIVALMKSVDQWGSEALREALQVAISRHVIVQPLRSGLSMVVRPYLWLLVGGAWILLGVACVNLSTLLLARGRSREREVAVRSSLGASPARLIRGAVLEALMLCVLGGGLGVLVCTWIGPAVLAIAPPEFRGFAVTPLDARVLSITLAVAVAAAVFSAIGPAITALRLDVIRILQREGRDRVTSRLRGGSALLAVEAAFGAALVVGAAVAVPGFLSLVYRFPGYQPRDLYTVHVPHGSEASDRSQPSAEVAARPARVRTVLETLRGLPQVERAAAQLNSFGYGNSELWRVQGVRTDAIAISDGWFETAGAVLRAGRALTSHDINEAAQTAVLNEAGVHLLWPQLPVASALGRTVATADGGRVIVGVAQDIDVKPGAAATPAMYIPITAANAAGRYGTQLTALVRMTSGARPDPLVIDARLNDHFSRESVTVKSVETAIEPAFRQPRLLAVLFGSVGCIALVLSGLGLYAVASFEMLRRRYEMGIRLALGGTRGDVALRLFLVTLRPVAVGTALGLSAAWWVAARGGASTIGMAVQTPLPYIAAGLLMLVMAVVATFGPAVRTSRLDAGDVLRNS